MRGIRQRFCKGFTLIELLITIAIISALMAFLLPQLGRFNRNQVLKNAAADLESNIRKTQNNANSGLNCNDTKDTAKDWKITFNTSEIADANKSYTIAATCSGGNVGISTIQHLPSGIEISQINIGTDIVTQSCSPASVAFASISSLIKFDTSDVGCSISSNTNAMSVFLNDSSIGIGTTIVIEKGGTVYIAASSSPEPTSVPTSVPTPSSYDLKAYYPNTDMYINYYLEGDNYISGSPVRSVLWFEKLDEETYKMYNWGPEDPNGRCHYDQLSWWADGFLRYVKTVDSCPSSTPNEVVYTPPIIFLPRSWDGNDWSYSGSSHTEYYENGELICTGTNEYTASIIGKEDVAPGVGIHWTTFQTTTWDDFGDCIDWDPTVWQEDYWLIDNLPIIGGGSAKGLRRSLGGNKNGADNWNIQFDSWKALPALP